MNNVAYLDRAVNGLRSIGVSWPKPTEVPVLALLEQVRRFDDHRVVGIGSTLQQSSAFNAVVREQIQGMDISSRYADIATCFDSIRTDMQRMVEYMSDGKLDFAERLKLAWTRTTRGSVPDRFDEIRRRYLDVARSANDQTQRENSILEAYRDFRMALKASEADSQEVLKAAEAVLAERKASLERAAQSVERHQTGDAAERARLELSRDEALRALQDEDKAFQIVKDVADDLKTAYSTAELVFARLQQTHAVKERLYQRALTFFSTNEVVFTGLAASFTAMAGLDEATGTLEQMKDGMNKGIEALAASGTLSLERGIRSGYGSTLQVGAVRALADSVVDFQSSCQTLVAELRAESSRTAAEIDAAAEDSKRRFAALVTRGSPT